MLNKPNQNLKNFFETEVKDAIPNIAKEFVEIQGFPEMFDEVMQDYKFVVIASDEDSVNYMFLEEPIVEVFISNDLYSVRVADSQGERLLFKTSELEAFVRYWNSDIVGYIGNNARLPEIKEY